MLFQQILILTATGKISFAQLSHVSIILTNFRSLPLVFILALCIKIHVYTIHNLAAIGRLQYFLKQHMSIFLFFKKLGREVGLTVLQPGLDELLLGKEL